MVPQQIALATCRYVWWWLCSTFKKFEHLIKKKVQGDTISCVPPQIYSQRFKEFIFKNLA